VVQGCSLSRNDINFIWAAGYFAETTFDDDAGAFTCDTLAISATSRTRTTCRYRFWPVGLAFRSRLCDYLEEPSKALTNAVNLPTGPPTVSRPISSIGLGELGLIRSWSLTKAWLPVSSSRIPLSEWCVHKRSYSHAVLVTSIEEYKSSRTKSK